MCSYASVYDYPLSYWLLLYCAHCFALWYIVFSANDLSEVTFLPLGPVSRCLTVKKDWWRAVAWFVLNIHINTFWHAFACMSTDIAYICWIKGCVYFTFWQVYLFWNSSMKRVLWPFLTILASEEPTTAYELVTSPFYTRWNWIFKRLSHVPKAPQWGKLVPFKKKCFLNFKNINLSREPKRLAKLKPPVY